MLRRFLLDKNEILLLSSIGSGWMPDLPAITAFRNGKLHLYSVTNGETGYPMLMALHAGHPTTYWDIITEDEYKDVRAVLRRPWISAGVAYPVHPDEIPQFDHWLTSHCSYPPQNPTWTALLRPVLCDDSPLTLTEPPPMYKKFPDEPDPGPLFSTLGTPLPPHVSAALIRQAVADGQSCPITLTPITESAAKVTPCGHVFSANALQIWLNGHHTCPQCRAVIRHPMDH